jgi:hypothetical protein
LFFSYTGKAGKVVLFITMWWETNDSFFILFHVDIFVLGFEKA